MNGTQRSNGGNDLIRKYFLTAGAVCALILGLWLPGWSAASQGHSSLTLDGVLHQLDREAKNFRSLSADVERTKVTVVVNDKSTETGSIQVRGDKMLLEMKAPDPRTILRTGDNLYVYTPGLKRVEEYNLGQHRSLVDQYLLLGFGTSGKDLEKAYLVTVLAEPTLDDKKTVELELTPKSPEARNQISKIQIWLDESTWLPIEQQFNETGSGDYFVIRYSKVVRNPDLGDANFKPHWPKGTEKVKPQG
ncbi:MAG: outer membrane lipoprotein carrier protein LolA [Candidatus Acidiferrales bacterium]